ncbi:hypothetical protein ACT8ZV_22490 [Nocardioides sp. MAHUQ-72]|uniref:hypothetical protein n=1 Tax=unclassified Nocardioides TaxID=2615069 RepID=UPI00360FBA74
MATRLVDSADVGTSVTIDNSSCICRPMQLRDETAAGSHVGIRRAACIRFRFKVGGNCSTPVHGPMHKPVKVRRRVLTTPRSVAEKYTYASAESPASRLKSFSNRHASDAATGEGAF